MATVINPFLSGEASGSVNGMTSSRNISGGFIRSKIKGVKKRSFFRTNLSNSYIKRSQFYWTNFSPEARQPWIDLAARLTSKNALGQTTRVYPETLFRQHCTVSLQYFGAQPIVAPDQGVIDYLPSFTLTRSASGISLSWDESIGLNYGIAVFTWRNLLSSEFRSRKRKLAYFFDATYTSDQIICSAAGAVSDLDFLPYAVAGTYSFFWIKTVDRYGRSSPFLHYQILNSP